MTKSAQSWGDHRTPWPGRVSVVNWIYRDYYGRERRPPGVGQVPLRRPV